jgi:predicted GNAT family acetyltransferase
MDIEVVDVPEAHRYEARVGGEVAGYAEYRHSPEDITFTHTVVDPDAEGSGVGSALARFALDDARRQQRTVVPQCSFIRGWIDRHPDYADLVRSPGGR